MDADVDVGGDLGLGVGMAVGADVDPGVTNAVDMSVDEDVTMHIGVSAAVYVHMDDANTATRIDPRMSMHHQQHIAETSHNVMASNDVERRWQ